MCRGLIVFGVVPLLAVGMRAQTDAPVAKPAELQRVLAKLGAAAVELERSLPSFTCEEDFTSRAIRDGKVKRETTATVTLRAQKQPDGSLQESHVYTEVNGRPFFEGAVKLPVFVSGGFNEVLRYFHPDTKACYEFELLPGKVGFKSPAAGPAHGCNEEGLTGFARVDAAGEPTYVERTVPAQTAKASRLATYAAVTLAPVTMGDKTYRLSSHMVAEMQQGKSVGRFEATYAKCRLFKSTVTIGPAEVLPDETSASKQ